MTAQPRAWVHYLTCVVVLVGMSVAIFRGEDAIVLPLVALLVASIDPCRRVAISGLRGFVAGGLATLALAYVGWLQGAIIRLASYELGALVMAVGAIGCSLCLMVSGIENRRPATAIVAAASCLLIACGLMLPAVQ